MLARRYASRQRSHEGSDAPRADSRARRRTGQARVYVDAPPATTRDDGALGEVDPRHRSGFRSRSSFTVRRARERNAPLELTAAGREAAGEPRGGVLRVTRGAIGDTRIGEWIARLSRRAGSIRAPSPRACGVPRRRSRRRRRPARSRAVGSSVAVASRRGPKRRAVERDVVEHGRTGRPPASAGLEPRPTRRIADEQAQARCVPPLIDGASGPAPAATLDRRESRTRSRSTVHKFAIRCTLFSTVLPAALQMALSIGIVGLPNVGKSTLQRALLGQGRGGDYPFGHDREPNVGWFIAPTSGGEDRLRHQGGQLVPTTINFATSPASSAARRRARVSQPVSRHPRGRRDREGRALLRGPERYPRREQGRPVRTSRPSPSSSA